MGSLTQRLWESIARTYAAILEHPFITGLTTGDLPREAFEFYVVQDALYLQEYSRALALCGARAPNEGATKMFAEHAAGAIDVEHQLHESFFKDFGLSEDDVRGTEPAPTNLAYTSYLLATAYRGSFPEALGAVLPCYWIYMEVGKELLQRGSPDALYTRWIDTYGGEEYGQIVSHVLRLTDEVGDDLSRSDEALMEMHFRTTARFEWMFWDMGYRLEQWPV
ncbi:MAG TPA: thiaminase II [Actinomycetota bacterium]|nr:thiaminase II [Actinomycetota bacterium]